MASGKDKKTIMEERIVYTPNMIFDESGLLWNLLPDNSLVSAKQKAIGFKKPKVRETMVACFNANGTIKTCTYKSV